MASLGPHVWKKGMIIRCSKVAVQIFKMVDVLVCKLVALARYRGAQKHTIKPTFYLLVFARFRSTVQEKFDLAFLQGKHLN